MSSRNFRKKRNEKIFYLKEEKGENVLFNLTKLNLKIPNRSFNRVITKKINKFSFDTKKNPLTVIKLQRLAKRSMKI